MPLVTQQLTRTEKKSSKYIRLYRGIYVPRGAELDGIARARIQHLRFEKAWIGGWAALNYHGIPYWRDVRHVWLHSKFNKGRVGRDVIVVERASISGVRNVDPHFPKLRVVEVAAAVVDCLIDIRARRLWQNGPLFDAVTPQQLLAIQVIDAAREQGLEWPDLERCARQRFCRRTLLRLWKLSSPGMHSPQETTTRLMISDLAPGLQPQYSHFEELGYGYRELVTISDLAWVELKIAVFYDGRHHLDEGVRASDAKKTLFLQEQGWEVIRVTSAMLQNPEKFRRQVRVIIEKQRRRLGSELG